MPVQLHLVISSRHSHLFENTFARTFSLDRFLKNFRPLLRVDISSLIVKNLSIDIRSI